MAPPYIFVGTDPEQTTIKVELKTGIVKRKIMAQNKTVETKNSVAGFLSKITDAKKRNDCSALADLFAKQTGFEPKMWGPGIIGFGTYHYKYESGREGDAPLVAFAPRASSIVLYLGSKFDKREELLSKFGKHKLSGGCIHVQRLEDIDTAVLIKMIKNSIVYSKKNHPTC